jgi:RimJ/RimL family protein N-acetyltransferase
MRGDQLIADSPRIQQWMHEHSRLPLQQDFIGIAREVSGEIVAAFGYDSFQAGCCQLHTCSIRPDGYNRRLLLSAFQVPFDQWGFDLLIGIVPAGNIASREIALRLGFTQFAELPGHLNFFKMAKADCRWLGLAEKRYVRRRQSTDSSQS